MKTMLIAIGVATVLTASTVAMVDTHHPVEIKTTSSETATPSPEPIINEESTMPSSQPPETDIDKANKRIDNHEVRISNIETKIAAVLATPAPSPAPITVVSYREIVIDPGTSDCEYTYSDGTTYQFHWKTTNPKGSFVADGNGSNGHWVNTVQNTGICNDKALGLSKN